MTREVRSLLAASRTLLAGGVLATSTLACTPDYGTIELEAISSPPGYVVVDRYGSDLEIPAGTAVVVRTDIDSSTRTEYDSANRLDLLSRDRSVATTFRRPNRWEFVIVGLNPGQTCLEVVIDGDAEDCIPMLVRDPTL